MRPSVAVLATLDTKGPEAAYLRDALQARGLTPLLVDCGILDPPLDVVPDVSSDQVARHSGSSIEQLRASGTRGRAVDAMRTMLADYVEHLHRTGVVVLGGVGIGGAEGAVMTAGALMRLPSASRRWSSRDRVGAAPVRARSSGRGT
jgi:uncharacterized protein (UPF0261 family)